MLAPSVSWVSQSTFFGLTIVLALAFVRGLWRCGKQPESDQASLRWAGIAIVLVVAWLGVSAELANSGVLRQFERRPHPFLLMAFGFTLATSFVAFSAVGKRLITGIDIRWLIGFQAFRIFVELWLHQLYEEGVVPVQMTYDGRNFDIVSGILAVVFFFWALRSDPPRWAILAFNVIGLGLLINIVTVAILSAPTPLRQFLNEPANTFVAYFPYVWLPAFLVQAAWFGHLLVFRWLRETRKEF